MAERSVDLERHEWEKMQETEINITEIAESSYCTNIASQKVKR